MDHPKDDLDRKALALFAEGKSTNYVAASLFNNNWSRAKKLRELFEQQPQAESESESESAPEGDEPEETDEPWDLTLRVPPSRVADIFATFTTDEQMNAISYVLQERLNAALGQ